MMIYYYINQLNSNAKLLLFVLMIVSSSTYAFSQSTSNAQVQLGTNFWNVTWPNSNPWKHNYKNAIDSKQFGKSNYNPWNKTFLNELNIYKCFRFMDFGLINNQNPKYAKTGTWNGKPEISWNDRNLETNPDQSQVSIYWMIDLCNRCNADMWLCIPELSDSTWWTGAAQLIKDKLNPNLKIYIEYSNEVWNDGFSAYHTALENGSKFNMWYPGDDHEKRYAKDRCAARYQVYISTQIWNSFKDTFGADSSRIHKVISGQTSNNWWNAVLLNSFTDTKINPFGEQPDFLALGVYFGQKITSNDKNKIQLLREDLKDLENNLLKTEKVINGTSDEVWANEIPNKLNKLHIISYEGGQHVTHGAKEVSDSPEIYETYTQFLKIVDKHISEIFCHYVHNGIWTDTGAWGAKAYIGQSDKKAHKFRALKNWQNNKLKTQQQNN